MMTYTCYPGRNEYYSGLKTKVYVDEKSAGTPAGACGWINTKYNGYDVKIFVSYITPIFAHVSGLGIIGLNDCRSATTTRQIVKELREKFHAPFYWSIHEYRIKVFQIEGLIFDRLFYDFSTNDYNYCDDRDLIEFLRNFSVTYTREF